MLHHIEGELLIDTERGVIWFNTKKGCQFRICNLPKPIPIKEPLFLDVTYNEGVNWNQN